MSDTPIIYPKAMLKKVNNHGTAMVEHLGLVLHVQEGNNSPYPWFKDNASRASSTWWISKAGFVEQYVDADLKAWAQGLGNARYNSVETEGFVEEPLTEAQINALTDLYLWGVTTFGWPVRLAERPGDRGFGWHGMGGKDWGHISCPGEWRRTQRSDVLARVALRRGGVHAMSAVGTVATQPPQQPQQPLVKSEQEDDMAEARVITYVDKDGRETKTMATLDGGIMNAGTPFYGNVLMLAPEFKQTWHETLALTAVDAKDPEAGYVIWNTNGDPYKFDKQTWADIQARTQAKK